jgi:VanZ family protein
MRKTLARPWLNCQIGSGCPNSRPVIGKIVGGAIQITQLLACMFRKFIATAAWASLTFIIYATLSSIGARPQMTSHESALVVFLERFGAYAVIGFLFYIAYPGRIALVCLLVLGTAMLLEFLQLFVPDRDARVSDALVKMAGGVTGILAARALLTLRPHRGWKN